MRHHSQGFLAHAGAERKRRLWKRVEGGKAGKGPVGRTAVNGGICCIPKVVVIIRTIPSTDSSASSTLLCLLSP
jgi:hypothetical protein